MILLMELSRLLGCPDELDGRLGVGIVDGGIDAETLGAVGDVVLVGADLVGFP
jgi:hypothetical protein